MPRSWEGDVEILRLQVEILTGMELDTNDVIRTLSDDEVRRAAANGWKKRLYNSLALAAGGRHPGARLCVSHKGVVPCLDSLAGSALGNAGHCWPPPLWRSRSGAARQNVVGPGPRKGAVGLLPARRPTDPRPLYNYPQGVGCRNRLAPQVEKQLDSLLKDGVEDTTSSKAWRRTAPFSWPFWRCRTNFEKPPKAAFIVAVTDYAKFRDGLLDAEQKKALKKGENGVEEAPLPFGDDKVYFLDRKGWAIVAPDKESIETFTKDFKGLDARISKEQGGKLLEADLGLYLSMDVFNKDYAEQIAAVKKEINDQALPQLENAGTLDKGTLKIYKAMIEGAFQAAEDSRGILLTAEFRPTGLAIHLQTEIRAPTAPTSKTLKPFHMLLFADLGRLPTGQAYYTGLAPTAELLTATSDRWCMACRVTPRRKRIKALHAAALRQDHQGRSDARFLTR